MSEKTHNVAASGTTQRSAVQWLSQWTCQKRKKYSWFENYFAETIEDTWLENNFSFFFQPRILAFFGSQKYSTPEGWNSTQKTCPMRQGFQLILICLFFQTSVSSLSSFDPLLPVKTLAMNVPQNANALLYVCGKISKFTWRNSLDREKHNFHENFLLFPWSVPQVYQFASWVLTNLSKRRKQTLFTRPENSWFWINTKGVIGTSNI